MKTKNQIKEYLKKSIQEASQGYKNALELKKISLKLKQNADEALLNAEKAVEAYQLLGQQYLEAYRKASAESESDLEDIPEVLEESNDEQLDSGIILKIKNSKNLN